MLLGSGHLHLQGRGVRVTIVGPTIPAGNTYPSQKTPSTLAGITPASPIPSDCSRPSLASYDTLWPTHSSQIRGVENAATMRIANVGAASLMTRSPAWTSHSSVGLTTWYILALVARGRTVKCLAAQSHLTVAGWPRAG